VVSIKEKVHIKSDDVISVGNAFSHQREVASFAALPEPSSLLLLAPLAALALRRLNRR
jgi:hypothetical protein